MNNYFKTAATLVGGTLLGMFIQAQRQPVAEIPATSTETAAASAQNPSVDSTKPKLPDAILEGLKIAKIYKPHKPLTEEQNQTHAIKTILDSKFGKDLASLMELTDGKYSIDKMSFSRLEHKFGSNFQIYLDTKIPTLSPDKENVVIALKLYRANEYSGVYYFDTAKINTQWRLLNTRRNPQNTAYTNSYSTISILSEYLASQEDIPLLKLNPDTATIQPPDRKSVTGVQRPAVGAATASQ